jgi:hypothetical protein
MKLSAESFRELARSLAGKRGEENERRRSPRVEVNSRLPMALINKGEALPAVPIMVRDVSPRGINILYPEPLPAGQQFTIQLESTSKITLLCTVLHSRTMETGLHSIGAEFTCVLPKPRKNPHPDKQTLDRIRHSMLD